MSGRVPKNNTEAIREMIDHRLKSISVSATTALPPDSHLDEDTISAFVEGRLSATESKPVLSHLTACGLCRRASAHLLRLENQIDEDNLAKTADEEPGRLQAFLSNLQSLVPSDENVVFAYQNPADEDPPEEPVTPEEKSNERES